MSTTSLHTDATAPTTRAASLLESYGPESPFFFTSPTRTLLAHGVDAALDAGAHDGRALPGRVSELLAAHRRAERPIVVGAIPFDDRAAPRLIVPRALHSAGPLDRLPAERARVSAAVRAMREVPAAADYARGVERAVALLRGGSLRKVVLARSLEIDVHQPVDVRLLLHRLARQNPGGYTFAVGLGGAPARTLIGASPELLVSRAGLEVIAQPLAGSAPRSADPEEDRRRAHALLTSPKDLEEHAIVADAVVAALRPLCRRVHAPATPSLRHTRTMWHLASRITGELADPAITSVALAAAMHPTPAVCGDPPTRARAAIAEIEPFDRGFFTGAVGWCDASGDGEWAVTIRCAEIAGRSLRLFAGAGIVPASDPAHELAETSAKLRTMLDAVGIERAPEGM